ncbi:hypothetical protein GGR56DRAFT_131136 [Xylariaceae sp. FL0804]|nr:hypothetical protein GGR56DRAFT_131136 [Xylariaceae sp. FL0804]
MPLMPLRRTALASPWRTPKWLGDAQLSIPRMSLLAYASAACCKFGSMFTPGPWVVPGRLEQPHNLSSSSVWRRHKQQAVNLWCHLILAIILALVVARFRSAARSMNNFCDEACSEVPKDVRSSYAHGYCHWVPAECLQFTSQEPYRSTRQHPGEPLGSDLQSLGLVSLRL